MIVPISLKLIFHWILQLYIMENTIISVFFPDEHQQYHDYRTAELTYTEFVKIDSDESRNNKFHLCFNNNINIDCELCSNKNISGGYHIIREDGYYYVISELCSDCGNDFKEEVNKCSIIRREDILIYYKLIKQQRQIKELIVALNENRSEIQSILELLKLREGDNNH